MNQMLETISQPVLAISEDTLIIDVLTLFQQNDCLNILPLIAADNVATGIIYRDSFLPKVFMNRYSIALHGQKPISIFIDKIPLSMNFQTTLKSATEQLILTMYSEPAFIITRDGLYFGVSTVLSLLETTTKQHIDAEKNLTPLSALLSVSEIPNEEMDSVLNTLYFSHLEHVEHDELMQLFSCHVSPEIAKKLWEDREQFFNKGGVRPDTLVATILFTDISDFTAIAETMNPLILMEWLNEYMAEMSRIISDHGGVINKYMGDAIMAIFGAPIKSETEVEITNDAVNAVQCAMQFDKRLCELNRKWQQENLPVITMRTGICTGSLVAGSLGGVGRMEYTVIGDTVNTAARLEGFDKAIATPNSNHPCRILISEQSYNYVNHLYEFEVVGECLLKGKNKSLKVYKFMFPTS